MTTKAAQNNGQDGAILKQSAIRTSVRFDHILAPFDARDILDILKELQYTPMVPIGPEPTAGGPDAGILQAKGTIAQKDGTFVDMNSEKQFIGFSCPNSAACLRALEDFLDCLEHHGFLSKRHILFFEFQARYGVETPYNAMESIWNLEKNSPSAKFASKIFGENLTQTSLRMFRCDSTPDNQDFFELWVQPSTIHMDRELKITLVYRDHILEKFKEFVLGQDEKILQLIKEFEYKSGKNKKT